MLKKLLSFFKDIKQVKRNHEDEILARENVCGVGIKDNQIIVLVDKKLPLDYLRPVDVVPSSVEGFETKVIEVGEITASNVSGCPVTGTACSIAGICKKGDSTFYLTNSHCKFGSVGKAFISPSPLDGGTTKNKIGVVFEQSNLSGVGEFKVDAMIAKADKPQEVTLETDKANLGDIVEFEGRTSGKQKLKVVADNVTIFVNYPTFKGRMVNQIMLEGIVRGGDSGSGLMKNGKICGLVFASNNVNFGFANHIQNVIDEIGISFKTATAWRYFKPSEVAGLKTELVDMLDEARHKAGIPFALTSTLRSPERNAEVGGVENSSHTRGLAVDIRVRNSAERFKILKALLDVGFRRVGVSFKGNFIHADIDKTKPQMVIWGYE